MGIFVFLILLPPISCPDSLNKNSVLTKSSNPLIKSNGDTPSPLVVAIHELPLHPRDDEWFTRDKFYHFSYSLGITGLSYHVYHCQFNNPNPGARYFAISIATLTGISKELYNKYYKKAKISYKDLTADAIGIIIGVILFAR